LKLLNERYERLQGRTYIAIERSTTARINIKTRSMNKTKQKVLDWLHTMQAKFGVAIPTRDLYFTGIFDPKNLESYGPRVHLKDKFQWFPKVEDVGYQRLLVSKKAEDWYISMGRRFASDMIQSDVLECWVGRTVRFRFTSSVGSYGWNAIWLYGVNEDGVNHEIDLIEHYGNRGEPKSETNLHWGNYEDNHNQAGPVPISCADSETVDGTIALDWSDPDEIVITFNGTVVRKIVRKDIIETFKTSQMRLMMNAGMKHGAEADSISSIAIHSILV